MVCLRDRQCASGFLHHPICQTRWATTSKYGIRAKLRGGLVLRTLSSSFLSKGRAQHSTTSRVSNMAISVLYTRRSTAVLCRRPILTPFPWGNVKQRWRSSAQGIAHLPCHHVIIGTLGRRRLKHAVFFLGDFLGIILCHFVVLEDGKPFSE